MYQKNWYVREFFDKCEGAYFKTDRNFAVSNRQSFTYIVQFVKYRKKWQDICSLHRRWAVTILSVYPCLASRRRWINRLRRQGKGLKKNCWSKLNILVSAVALMYYSLFFWKIPIKIWTKPKIMVNIYTCLKNKKWKLYEIYNINPAQKKYI